MSFKSDFPILKNKIRGYPITYLDSAASTQKPEEVINSISAFYQNSYENVHRGMNTLSIKATDMFERARENVRSFINANLINEVIFTSGATDSINKISQCLPQLINEGDKIVITGLEHHSNYLPWLQIAKKFNFIIEVVSVNENASWGSGSTRAPRAAGRGAGVSVGGVGCVERRRHVAPPLA